MAVMNRHAPFGRTIDGVAYQRELIAVGRSLFGPEVVMKVNRVAPNLIGAKFL